MLNCNFSITNTIKCRAVKFGIFLILIIFKINAQPPQSLAFSYINSFAAEAVDQMIEYKIPASVTLAQAIFESSCGNSQLAQRSNNHFGIKCHTQWGGDTIRKSDDSLNECFRKYNSVKDSYSDHSLFLVSRARYKPLFNLQVSDYKGWCYGLKNSGYATYTYYPEVLIKIIEEYSLYEFDRIESIPGGILFCSKKETIVESNFTSQVFTLKEFCQNSILWNDERDILIQSLEMIIENPAKEIDLFVEN